MIAPVFYRNLAARDHLELFLISAVTSLLLLRFYLFMTGYPQLGKGSLHIAHMLYGGLLMLAAIVILLSFIGRRAQRLAACIGGLGFGIFIDELGKFITRDNNYFFRPTIGIIYAIFASLYLAFNFISRTSSLSTMEYQLNALLQLEEAVRNDLDTRERDHIKQLLAKADQQSPLTQELKALVSRLETVPITQPRRFRRVLMAVDRAYSRFWKRRDSNRVIGLLFIVEALIFLLLVVGGIVNNLDAVHDVLNGHNTYGHTLIFGQLAASILVTGYAVLGAVKLRVSRAEAFEQFRRATLVNLLLTEFFIFSRIQFGAIPGFLLNLILLLALHYAIHQELRLRPEAITI